MAFMTVVIMVIVGLMSIIGYNDGTIVITIYCPKGLLSFGSNCDAKERL
jgi:hypothetical protein